MTFPVESLKESQAWYGCDCVEGRLAPECSETITTFPVMPLSLDGRVVGRDDGIVDGASADAPAAYRNDIQHDTKIAQVKTIHSKMGLARMNDLGL